MPVDLRKVPPFPQEKADQRTTLHSMYLGGYLYSIVVLLDRPWPHLPVHNLSICVVLDVCTYPTFLKQTRVFEITLELSKALLLLPGEFIFAETFEEKIIKKFNNRSNSTRKINSFSLNRGLFSIFTFIFRISIFFGF